MLYLRSVTFNTPLEGRATRFPFAIPAIQSLLGQTLTFTTPVTLFVGENGSGKSTVMEGLARAIGSITVGRYQAGDDATLGHVQALADSLKLVWNHKSRRGFFLRAEDFFGYAQHMQQTLAEMEGEIRRIEADTTLSKTAKGLAIMPYAREVAAMRSRYGDGLDTMSHGESFVRLFQSRFVPNGLYLLDEPEAPLSPMRQLAFLAIIKQAVEEQGAQCIIATHSPIILALPHAIIYSFDNGAVRPVAYEDTEHVRLTRDFLNRPDQFLKHL
ncbi:MAG TPA: AAA family ATPase [Ktedonobacterales bacterium]|nr:AAA family ATPase [Ktedonobacterales bacterium]